MFVVLLVAGFLRSLQFSALNTLAYADVDHAEMAKANAFYTVLQQLSLAMGVALAAFILDARLWWAGREDLVAADFSFALVAVASISVFAVWFFRRLEKNAGASVSGRADA